MVKTIPKLFCSSLAINVVGRAECFGMVFHHTATGPPFICPKFDGLPASGQKPQFERCGITLYLGGITAHKKVLGGCVCGTICFSTENVRRPLTQESGWIRGTQKTSVFQENTMSISAASILKEIPL